MMDKLLLSDKEKFDILWKQYHYQKDENHCVGATLDVLKKDIKNLKDIVLDLSFRFNTICNILSVDQLRLEEILCRGAGGNDRL